MCSVDKEKVKGSIMEVTDQCRSSILGLAEGLPALESSNTGHWWLLPGALPQLEPAISKADPCFREQERNIITPRAAPVQEAQVSKSLISPPSLRLLSTSLQSTLVYTRCCEHSQGEDLPLLSLSLSLPQQGILPWSLKPQGLSTRSNAQP